MTPAKMVPANPLERMMISAAFKEVRLSPNWPNESPGVLKYVISFTLFTMKTAISGNNIAINHEDRKSILSKKDIPKNSTKNKTTDIARIGIDIFLIGTPQEASFLVY